MKINVLIFNGFGTYGMSKKVRELLLDETLCFPYNRIISKEKLKEIEKKAGMPLDISRDISLFEQCKNSEYGIIRFGEKQFYFYNFNTKTLSPFIIKEVDISRPWKIEDYDGAEYIQYLDYEIEHKDINYCDYK